MKTLYAEYLVKNADEKVLLSLLHAKNVCVYDITPSKDGVVLRINFKDERKLFAISHNMCYNITKLRYKGKFAVLKKCVDNIGLAVGFIGFCLSAYLTDGFITEIKYLKDANCFERQVEQVLSADGIKPYSFFNADCNKVSGEIYKKCDKIAFVSVEKRGRKLLLTAYKTQSSASEPQTKKSGIYSTCSGKVVKISKLSGTAVVKIGDEVKEGDLLIGGYYEKDGERQNSYALGEVEIETEKEFCYVAKGKSELYKNRAIAIAVSGETGEISSYKVIEEEKDGEYVYRVFLYVLTVVK